MAMRAYPALARAFTQRLAGSKGCSAHAPSSRGFAPAASLRAIIVAVSAKPFAPEDKTRHGAAASILAVVGLQFEARIVSGGAVRTVVFGTSPLAALVLPTDCGVISFGICGGLAPNLRSGACVIASSVSDGRRVWATDAAWLGALVRLIPGAVVGPMLSLDAPILAVEDKARLHRSCGAVAVDMESHAAAAVAEARGLPFAVVRAVADDATCALLAVAIAGRRSDGSVDVPGVLAALGRKPGDFGPLMRLAARTVAARATLARLRPILHRDFARRAACGRGGSTGLRRPGRQQGQSLADSLEDELMRLGDDVLD